MPSTRALLEKLGLTPRDDSGGLVTKALELLADTARRARRGTEAMPEFLSTRILVEECGTQDPALLAANLAQRTLFDCDGARVASAFSPRVAEIIDGMRAFLVSAMYAPDPASMGEMARDAHPAAQLIVAAANIQKIEEETRDATRNALLETCDVSEALLSPFMGSTGEKKLEARFNRAVMEGRERAALLAEKSLGMAVPLFGGGPKVGSA